MASRKSKMLVEYTERYGPTMDVSELCEVFCLERNYVANLINSGRLPFDTFQLKPLGAKRGKHIAHTSDVVRYLEGQNTLA
jgi:hypothetical protein